MSFCTKDVEQRQCLNDARGEDADQPSLFSDLPQNQTVLATGQSFEPAGGDLPMPAVAPTIGHNGGPAMGAGYDFEPVSRRWIAVATDMRFHHLVGCGQSVPPADPSRGAWSRYEAWQDLICEAAWKQRSIINKGKTILLDRGQLMAARSWLAQRWNWTEKTVRTWISKLENETMIEIERGQQEGQQKQNLSNVVTICNYDIYQTARELQNLLKGQRGASEGPAKGQRGASEGPDLVPVYKGTKEREREIARERELFDPAEPDAIPEPYVNGVCIKGASFGTLLYESLDAAADSIGIEIETARQIAVANAKQWEANGKKVRDPLALITSALKAHKRPAPKPKKQIDREYTDNFEAWWKLYPRKEGKGEAFDVWQRIGKTENHRKAYRELQRQLPDLSARAKDKNGNFCPHARTWLSQRRFDDEPSSANGASNGKAKTDYETYTCPETGMILTRLRKEVLDAHQRR